MRITYDLRKYMAYDRTSRVTKAVVVVVHTNVVSRDYERIRLTKEVVGSVIAVGLMKEL